MRTLAEKITVEAKYGDPANWERIDLVNFAVAALKLCAEDKMRRALDDAPPDEVRSRPLDRYMADAEALANSDSVIRVFAAPEWNELSEDGKQWLAAIVRELYARHVVTLRREGGGDDLGHEVQQVMVELAGMKWPKGSDATVERAMKLISRLHFGPRLSPDTRTSEGVREEQPAPSQAVQIDYTNYRGERSLRLITPNILEFTSSEWHPERQWLLRAYDHEKKAMRQFALRDIHSWDRTTATLPVGETCNECGLPEGGHEGRYYLCPNGKSSFKPLPVGDEAVERAYRTYIDTIEELDDYQEFTGHIGKAAMRAALQAAAISPAEPEHSCPACPVEVRDLAACAHNAHNAFRAGLRGDGSWERALRKMDILKGSLDRFQPIMDAHFAAVRDLPPPPQSEGQGERT